MSASSHAPERDILFLAHGKVLAFVSIQNLCVYLSTTPVSHPVQAGPGADLVELLSHEEEEVCVAMRAATLRPTVT